MSQTCVGRRRCHAVKAFQVVTWFESSLPNWDKAVPISLIYPPPCGILHHAVHGRSRCMAPTTTGPLSRGAAFPPRLVIDAQIGFRSSEDLHPHERGTKELHPRRDFIAGLMEIANRRQNMLAGCPIALPARRKSQPSPEHACRSSELHHRPQGIATVIRTCLPVSKIASPIFGLPFIPSSTC